MARGAVKISKSLGSDFFDLALVHTGNVHKLAQAGPDPGEVCHLHLSHPLVDGVLGPRCQRPLDNFVDDIDEAHLLQPWHILEHLAHVATSGGRSLADQRKHVADCVGEGAIGGLRRELALADLNVAARFEVVVCVLEHLLGTGKAGNDEAKVNIV